MELQWGRVKAWKGEYGFISSPGKPDDLFHLNNGKVVTLKGNSISFEDPAMEGDLSPSKDDDIFFFERDGSAGRIASPWVIIKAR